MNAARNRFSVVVDASAPVPPYPADTRAKGWRFDLDYERIEQSDTWVLAPADLRPWLLMLWLTAWKQTPCGSLPIQDELIAARIGMDLRTFRGNRDLLMRGWEIHNDGRYYHHVITEQVLSLIAGREKENAWKRGQRNKNQRLTDACPPGQSDDSSRNQCGVHAPSPSPSPVLLTPEVASGEVVGASRKRDDTEAKRPRATRLPQGWALTKGLGEWAVQELGMSPEQIRTEAAKFADYWHAKAGKDATKADWPATWRNWCRKAVEDAVRAPARSAGPESFRAQDARIAAEQVKRLTGGLVHDRAALGEAPKRALLPFERGYVAPATTIEGEADVRRIR